MARTIVDGKLDELLAAVSRSFYFSLAVLPRPVRGPLSLAYLIARAADTIADTPLVRWDRKDALLVQLRTALTDEDGARAFGQALRRELEESGAMRMSSTTKTGEIAERQLLVRIDECLAQLWREPEPDRTRSQRLLSTLIAGMRNDVARFPTEPNALLSPRALASMKELDEHTFLAAGCVGRFWTEMLAAHLPALEHLREPALVESAVRMGKALQFVNLIRDAAADLAIGRCYLPLPLLERHGLLPPDLIGERRRLARPALLEMCALALEHADAAFPYVLAIPVSAPRIRLACVWPLWIGLSTLEAVAHAQDPFDPGRRIKMSKASLYGLMAESLATVGVTPLLAERHRRRRLRVAAALIP